MERLEEDVEYVRWVERKVWKARARALARHNYDVEIEDTMRVTEEWVEEQRALALCGEYRAEEDGIGGVERGEEGEGTGGKEWDGKGLEEYWGGKWRLDKKGYEARVWRRCSF